MVGKGDVRAIFGLPVTTDAGERLPPLTVETDFIHIYHQKFSSLLSKCVSIVLFWFVGGILKMDSPAVVIPHLLALYAPQDDVRPPELVNVKIAEVTALHGYPHFVSQPAVKVAPLLSCFRLPLPKRIEDSVAHLLLGPHRFVGKQSQGFPWAGLMRANIGPALLTKVAVAAPVLPAIDPGI